MNLITPVVNRWIQEAREDPDGFWARAANELPWFRTWDRVFEWEPPTFRWFVGGETNLAFNALDHHVKHGRGEHTALIYFNERGERRLYTYAQLLREVERIAAALRGMGVNKGDRLTIYMPICPEAIALMLATVRIGAIHLVVFAGFGEKALADRIAASGSRLVFTADVTYRKGKDVPLKRIVDEAVRQAGGVVEHVVALNRTGAQLSMHDGLDLTWDDFMARGSGQSGDLCADGIERAGVHPCHLRHHRQAEAGRAHAWRLPGAYLQHGPLVFWLEADRRLVGHVRYRLDRRPQLHGVRAAHRGLHERSVRRSIGSPARGGELEVGDGGVRRDWSLHVADRGADADALW